MGTHPSTAWAHTPLLHGHTPLYTALYTGSQPTVGKSQDELTRCMIATHQQVLEAHATGVLVLQGR